MLDEIQDTFKNASLGTVPHCLQVSVEHRIGSVDASDLLVSTYTCGGTFSRRDAHGRRADEFASGTAESADLSDEGGRRASRA